MCFYSWSSWSLFRKRSAQADIVAREIEGDNAGRRQVELENGDEEEAFSAVHRPVAEGSGRDRQRDRSSRYVFHR